MKEQRARKEARNEGRAKHGKREKKKSQRAVKEGRNEGREKRRKGEMKTEREKGSEMGIVEEQGMKIY